MPDIAEGRLAAEDYARHFGDAKPPLSQQQVVVEASRCYFCYDAPCVEACPTSIDIPSFIRKTQTGNLKGAALDILEANIMGGMCARVCPTEVLCEQACVRAYGEGKPVKIGLLQRNATDWLFARGLQPFTRAPATGRRIAVVGGGPAGLSCAHRLAMLGHEVTVFEAAPKLGGLNEYGIAAYKTPNDFAQAEVDFILAIGGIAVETDCRLGRDVSFAELRRAFDAVFLGVGLADTNALGIDGEGLAGVEDAVDYIARLRQAPDLAALPVGRRIVVIGGGNTAIDIAVQTKRLGAEDVTLVYRRGVETMSATWHEREFAQINGVSIMTWAQPVGLVGADGHVREVVFERTRPDDRGRAVGTGQRFSLNADQVFKAIGQKLVPDPLRNGSNEIIELEGGKIAVDAERRTSLTGVWAGGDCIPGVDLTVQAVEDGKVAAHSIDSWLAQRA